MKRLNREESVISPRQRRFCVAKYLRARARNVDDEISGLEARPDITVIVFSRGARNKERERRSFFHERITGFIFLRAKGEGAARARARDQLFQGFHVYERMFTRARAYIPRKAAADSANKKTPSTPC